MQSSFYTPTNTHHLPIPWKIPETQFTTQKCVPKTRKRPFRAFNITNSLRTSIGYEPEETVGKEPGHTKECRLPVVIQRSGKVSRYFWDGGSLQLVGVDGGATSFSFDFDDGFRRLYRICTMAVRDFFIPKKVSDNYMDYVKWKFLHRVFSSALQVLATQAMFRAIGVGFSRSLPSAAALNWVLKDGLGRLSRCIYTASQASAFDTNLKRVRFSTSILFSLSIGVELLTPAFPKYFLLLASVANIAKQISLACLLATGSAVHRSFAIADNLGEVSAKSQIQTVCFDNLGLLLAASLNMLLKNNQRLLAGLPFIVYPIFSAIDLLGIYQQLKHVHLQTLTKDRLEIILDTWIEVGYVPSPADISKQEGIGFPWSKGKELLPIKIGCINPKDQVPKLSMMAMQSINGDDYYFISMEITYTGIRRTKQRGIILCLREGAGTRDIILGLLQACYVRKVLHLKKSKWESMVEASDLSDSAMKEWFKLLEECKKRAQGDLLLLNEHMSGLGWAAKNILLSKDEQTRYSFVED
ncbi:protein root UVB sensitive 4 isoform X1 [Ziziphus jujuba]|uniref:Protein root UVB sensitive 4 isoform X1 n=1 Tax=Ziziphus jujuba TaxID=326968 RepID=A0A6P4A8M7_ZIZJJ|nr:protein root UVB sensitive 4 isoform X1 [Ziziphus jujuba]